MCNQYAIPASKRQEAEEKSQEVTRLIEEYLEPLVERLDAYIDKRLVRTFLEGIRTLIEARTQAPGLTISELGSILLSGRQATAGEKRLHRLLTSKHWNEDLIGIFQWNEAEKRYEEMKREGEEVYVIWDESVIEKPESRKAEDLCAVRSSKVARKWGRKVYHIFDRGYAGGPWLEMMWRHRVDFLIRWKKGIIFEMRTGRRNH